MGTSTTTPKKARHYFYEEWKESYVKEKMEQWENQMTHRVSMIERHIKAGYDKAVTIIYTCRSHI